MSWPPVARSIWWKALVISLTAALPPWIVSAVVLDVLFPYGSTSPQRWLLHYHSAPVVLIPIIGVPLSGGGVFLHIMLSALSGYGILVFAAGALTWDG